MTQTYHTARRLAMLAAVAFTFATLSAPALAEHDGKPHEKHAGKMKEDKTPVSEADLAAARVEHEKIKSLSPEERKAYFKDRRAEMEKLSPEERRAKHRARKAYFETLPQAEKDAIKAEREKHRAERKAAWEKMTPEERAAKKAEMKERHMRKDHKDHGDHKSGADMPDEAAPE